MDKKIYCDNNSRYFISQGIGRGKCPWFTVRVLDGWDSQKKVNSPALPCRYDQTEAQADLDAWAQKKGLTLIEKYQGSRSNE